jgi:hypothetical protein
MVEFHHLHRGGDVLKMSGPTEEVVEIFEKLTPENQQNLLMYLRVAYVSEGSVRKSINRALGQEDSSNQNNLPKGES